MNEAPSKLPAPHDGRIRDRQEQAGERGGEGVVHLGDKQHSPRQQPLRSDSLNPCSLNPESTPSGVNSSTVDARNHAGSPPPGGEEEVGAKRKAADALLATLGEHGCRIRPTKAAATASRGWVERGVTAKQILQALSLAKERRNGSRQPIGVAFLDRLLTDEILKPRSAKAANGEDALLRRARALGLEPRPGESWDHFRARVSAARAS